ncbi:hypothetical protein CHS0354_010995 [Potamilus streckersoni]|uniref:Uncharacterized protein n=1 Tax=Potamilus streckersoni TaxID=2493646 RepID=A0AAE0TM67_9BIVA|nr:hypothetical protein CHS0354_010995 [Potamilus streckersoni]
MGNLRFDVEKELDQFTTRSIYVFIRYLKNRANYQVVTKERQTITNTHGYDIFQVSDKRAVYIYRRCIDIAKTLFRQKLKMEEEADGCTDGLKDTNFLHHDLIQWRVFLKGALTSLLSL